MEAAVGAAIASWPDGTVTSSRPSASIPPSGVARLHLGFALLASGDEDGASREWREVERVDPDSSGRAPAEDLLNPQFAPGRPPFVAPLRALPARGPLARGAARRAERRAADGGVDERLSYGIASSARAGRSPRARPSRRRSRPTPTACWRSGGCPWALRQGRPFPDVLAPRPACPTATRRRRPLPPRPCALLARAGRRGGPRRLWSSAPIQTASTAGKPSVAAGASRRHRLVAPGAGGPGQSPQRGMTNVRPPCKSRDACGA